MKKVLVIDNYDSFTYNLVHYLEDLKCKVTVKRNDKLTLDEVEAFDKIVLSPGPGIPDEAGLLKDIIAKYASTKSIFESLLVMLGTSLYLLIIPFEALFNSSCALFPIITINL